MKAATDMFLYLGRGSDLDNSLVEYAWNVANRSTRSFYITRQWNGALGDRPKAFRQQWNCVIIEDASQGEEWVDSDEE